MFLISPKEQHSKKPTTSQPFITRQVSSWKLIYLPHRGSGALHNKNMPGRPDIVLPKYKTIIFIHGCFWHGHNNCKYYVVPKTRTDWWLNKIGVNKVNDVKAITALKQQGWKIITI